jgi:hypothetical protein
MNCERFQVDSAAAVVVDVGIVVEMRGASKIGGGGSDVVLHDLWIGSEGACVHRRCRGGGGSSDFSG